MRGEWIEFFLWLCSHNSVWVKEVLAARGLNVSPLCPHYIFLYQKLGGNILMDIQARIGSISITSHTFLYTKQKSSSSSSSSSSNTYSSPLVLFCSKRNFQEPQENDNNNDNNNKGRPSFFFFFVLSNFGLCYFICRFVY
jgi:hypothetical protein